MAVKRTSGVSPIISSLDRRVKGVESGQTTLNAQYSNAITVTVSDDDDPNLDGPDTTSGVAKKYEYRRVLKAYIYGDKVTGFGSRCELYFGEDPQIEAKDPVDVQAVHGTSTDNFNISPKQYKVYETDTSPWTGRQSWRNTPTTGNNGNTITNTVWFNPVVEVPSTYSRTSGIELITTRRIDTMSVTGSTVTVTLNTTHLFEVGDVIYVDSISTHTVLFGVDGLFKVSEVVSSTVIKYELDNPVPTPFSLTSVQVGTKYVYPVARRYVKDGEVWVDKSVEPNKVWVWNVLRWYDTAEGVGDIAAAKDGIAPSPVTSLSATSTAIPGVNGEGATAEITVSWTAPTTRSNGDPIADYLGYYLIEYKRTTETNWTGKLEVAGSATSAIIRDPFIRLLTTYDIRVYVYDIMEQPSTSTSTTVTTTNFSETLNAPSTPVLTTRLGTITATWDGLDSLGNSPVQGVRYVEVHYSTTNNFTPGVSTLYTTFPITLQGNYAVVSNLNYNTTYYFKLIFVRSDGYTNQKSSASAQASAQVSPLVDTDIVYSTLNNWPFNGGVVPANALASGAINASNMFGANVVVQNAIAANAIGANQIAAGSIIAGKIAANAITASEIAADTISAGMIKSNAIEADKIAAGAITASIIGSKEIELKASPTASQRIVMNSSGITAYNGGDTTFSIDGVSGSINAASITVSNIDASKITVGTLSADRIAAESITAGKLEADLTMTKLIKTGAAGTNRIEIRGSTIANPGIVHLDGVGGSNFRFYANGSSYLNNLELDNASLTGTLTATGTISGATISGGTIRTASSGKRVVLSGADNEVQFWGTGGTQVGSIGGASTTTVYDATAGHSFQVGGSTVLSINSSGIGLATGEVFTSNLPVSGTITSTSSITADTFVRSGIGGGTFATLHSNGGISSSGGPAPSTGEIQAGALISSGGVVQVSTMAISTTNPIVRWSGGSRVALTVTSSDARVKSDIQPIEEGLSIINQLTPITYDSLVDSSDRRSPGFIAQDVEQVFCNDVGIVGELDASALETDIDLSDGPLKTLNYESFIPYLTKAIQELSAKNDSLEARLAELEGNA
jgi:hypothetical protein